MNKNIIKLFVILVMCFIFCGVLVACGSQSEQVGPLECSDDCDCRKLQGPQGVKGDDGADGLTPYVGENGNWWIGEKDTKVPARAEDLTDCENHHWESEPLRAHSYDVATNVATVGVNILICKDCGDAAFEYINHSYTSVVTDPTCTAKGYTTYTCACGHSYKADETEMKPHTYNSVVTDPECGVQGYTTHTCSVCGDSYVDSYTGALTHTPKVAFDIDNPDLTVWHEADREDNIHPCLTEQVYATNCIYCGIEIFETGHAAGHDWGVWKKAHNNTNVCDCEWNVFIKECARCFEKVASSDPAEIGSAYQVGHEYEGWKLSKEPTKTEEGKLVNTCANCVCVDCQKYEILPVLDESNNKYSVVTYEAECEADGKKVYTYTIDGQSFSFTEVLPMTGHTYGSNSVVNVITVPTEATEGSATISCEKCGATKTVVLPKLGEFNYVIDADPVNCQAQYKHILVINGVNIEVSFNIVGKYIHLELAPGQPTYEVEGENYIYTVYKCTRCNDWVVIKADPKP